ncbi:MAG: hypothetical protein ACK4K7_12715 [Allosphingosinicella sp.]|uniref:hypothetical protein n=1 Tax=Allosphingosinicella sp. TaxID=2823234 RepID=UPI00392C1D4E
MRKMLIALTGAVATLAAVPAAAQYQDHSRGSWNQNENRGPSRQAIANLHRDLQRIDHHIQLAGQRRQLSRQDATQLRREVSQIQRQLQRSSRTGLSGREFAQLRQQVNRLEQRVQYAARFVNGRRG